MASLRPSGKDVHQLIRKYYGYIFILPSLFFVLLLKFYSLIYSFTLSLQRIEFGVSIQYVYVGLLNWKQAFSDPLLYTALRVTLNYAFLVIAGGLPLALAIALILNEDFRGRNILRVCLLIPWAIPYTCSGQIWNWIYYGTYGLLNTLLGRLHIISQNITWLGSPVFALYALVFAQIWKDVPFMALLLLAVLQSVPVELHEAATIDGAGSWRRFLHVTLPHIQKTALFVMLIETIEMIKVFDLIYICTKGMPANSTLVLYMYVYRQGFMYINFGYASALAYVLTGIVFCLSLFYVIMLFPKGEKL